jgi:hypothetical protein
LAGSECRKLIGEIIKNNELQKTMPLIKNSNLLVDKVNKIIPIWPMLRPDQE